MNSFSSAQESVENKILGFVLVGGFGKLYKSKPKDHLRRFSGSPTIYPILAIICVSQPQGFASSFGKKN